MFNNRFTEQVLTRYLYGSDKVPTETASEDLIPITVPITVTNYGDSLLFP